MSSTQINRLDAGLQSVRGAQELISMISSRRTVNKLVLGHNQLGDDGCIVLFEFLGSSVGRKYRISEISLNSNEIGNRGLLAIAEYLKHNIVLKELFLQDNKFKGDPAVFKVFSDALNTSQLETLSLTTNRDLADKFIEVFLPAIHAPFLREMHLSAMGLTHRSVPHITAYISSPRCRLQSIRCNGNSLGLRGVKSIVAAIERNNYALTTVELYANHLTDEDEEHASSDEHADEAEYSDADESAAPNVQQRWITCENRLKQVLLRNAHLKRITEKEALSLLRYARTVLLCAPLELAAHEISESNSGSGLGASASSAKSAGAFLFKALPIEIQFHILSFLAPSLSAAQRIRIYQYASDIQTLPALLSHLPGIPFINGGRAGEILAPLPIPSGVLQPPTQRARKFGLWGERQHMSNYNSGFNKDKERTKWLDVVGCSAYER